MNSLEGMRGGSLHVDDAVLALAADAAGVSVPHEPGLLNDGADVRALGAMLVDELSRGGADAQLCAGALVDAIAVKTVRGLPQREASARDARVRAAVDAIHARFSEPIDVDDIAAACGMSRFHLSRLMKAATGKSPYQYLLEVRLDEAARFLRRGRRRHRCGAVVGLFRSLAVRAHVPPTLRRVAEGLSARRVDDIAGVRYRPVVAKRSAPLAPREKSGEKSAPREVDVVLGLDEADDEAALKKKAAHALGLSQEQIPTARIVRKAIDARARSRALSPAGRRRRGATIAARRGAAARDERPAAS